MDRIARIFRKKDHEDLPKEDLMSQRRLNESQFNIQDMQKLKDIGEVSTLENRVDWKIPKFYSFPHDGEFTISSPRFSIANRTWILFARIGLSLEIGVYQVTKKVSDFKVRFGIVRKHIELSSFGILSCGGGGLFSLVDRSEIDSNQKECVPGGNLNLFFIVFQRGTENGDSKEVKEDCAEKIFSHTAIDIDLSKLQKDLEFLLEGNVSDVIVKVKEKEFKCQRCILAARSPVFLAMVTHDTKEKATGVIEIEDADPIVFLNFLHYLYTGNMKTINPENVPDLYTISDKYQVIQLKNNCVKYIRGNISMDNFCDIIALSLRHNEKELLEACIQFFKETWNSLEIIKTSKWQKFMSENPIACNELLIKLLESKKS